MSYNHHFNQLSPSEDELLSVLSGECGEVINAICKIQRHGYGSFNPDNTEAGDNRDQLEKEIGHLLSAINLLVNRGDLLESNIESSQLSKIETISKWLHHQTVPFIERTIRNTKKRIALHKQEIL